MQLVLTATQDAPIAAKCTDAKGNPAVVQDAKYESSDAAIVTLTPDPGGDSLKTTVSAVGPLGAALVTFTADADLGAGVVPIIGTMDVVVNPGMATVVELSAGAPVEQGAARRAR
jgi:hypothetical protein